MWVEEKEAVRLSYCKLGGGWVGGRMSYWTVWVGGWVGGWDVPP